MDHETEAVEALVELGLTEYEARCFVSLARVSKGTAKDVNELSGVPRARVYDTLKRLHQRGLVDVQQSEPREYRAIPIEAATEKLRQDYGDTLDAAKSALTSLQSSDDAQSSEHVESEGAWAIADHEHVTDRIASLLESADDEVYLLVADKGDTDRTVLDELSAAANRGVRVAVEVPSESRRERMADAVPDADVAISEIVREADGLDRQHPARALLVDRRAVLLSGVGEGRLPGTSRETAIWSEELDHGLVIWVQELLGERLEATFGEA